MTRLDHSAAAAPPPPASRGAAIISFLRDLGGQYAADAHGAVSGEIADVRRSQLLLGEAAVRYAVQAADRPPQIVVAGPTQVGKSTVVNLLLGGDHAGVSPLAGFTVHAHGFASGVSAVDDWSHALFPQWRRAAYHELSRDQQDVFALGDAPAGALPGCVIWDTPDFDSLASESYRRGVFEPLALADLVVIVVSKEKYADMSVWRTLRLLASLQRATLICLNKAPRQGAEELQRSLRSRLDQLAPFGAGVEVIPIPFTPGGPDSALAAPLRSAVTQRLQRVSPRQRLQQACAYVRGNWSDWTEPIERARAALQDWDAEVHAAVAELLDSYQRDFLDHPQRYDSFRRMTVELLQLLELPGVAATLHHVRRVVTWPARQVFALGRSWWHRGRTLLSSEELVLESGAERLLLRLARFVGQRAADGGPQRPLWQSLGESLQRADSAMRADFAAAADAHRRAFAQEIHAAAEGVYQQLRQRPALLNTLRATRATADAASILLAVKSGGLHLNDLLMAPAVFAVTSLLTEGALSEYLRRVAAQLRERQMQRVREDLVQGALRTRLRELPTTLPPAATFGISPERADTALHALAELERSQP